MNANPTALLKIKNFTSDLIHLEKGARQGCPLSPLVFALVVEPLVGKMGANNNIAGVTIGKTEHKIGLYADNTILPTFIFYFHSLPIEVNPKELHSWQKACNIFIWNYKTPRINFGTIKRPW